MEILDLFEMLWDLHYVLFRSAWGACEFLPHTYSSLNSTDYDIVMCTWVPSCPGHQGHYGAMSGGDTAIPGIRIDICMSDLMLSDFCEVSWTLCAKTLFFLVPLTDTNPLETISIFFSSSFHYFLSYFLSPVSSTIIFFFPNHTQEEKASKNRNKNPLSQCSQHRFDPWSGKIPHTMWYGQKTNKKRDMLQFLNIFLFTFTWWEITATGIIKSGLHLELGRSYLEQSRFFIVLSWPGESVYCFLTCSLKDSIQIFFFLILFIHLFYFCLCCIFVTARTFL